MTLETLHGGGLDIDEPVWSLLIPNQGRSRADSNRPWRDYAHREWLRITSALRDAGTLAPENKHMIQRLIIFIHPLRPGLDRGFPSRLGR